MSCGEVRCEACARVLGGGLSFHRLGGAGLSELHWNKLRFSIVKNDAPTIS